MGEEERSYTEKDLITMHIAPELASAYIKANVENGKLPRYVYKYKSLATEFALDFITKSEIYFSTPETFNDPFDCSINVTTETNIETIKDWIRRTGPSTSPAELNLLLKAWRNNPAQMNKLVNDTKHEILNSSGIFYLAGCNDSILMWSHYGDSHKGICLKFDLLGDPNLFTIPLQVMYVDEYPKYNYFRDQGKGMEFLIQTKAKCWEYEQEMRIFKDKPGPYKFNQKALVEVCFGCNVPPSDVIKVQTLANDNGFTHVI